MKRRAGSAPPDDLAAFYADQWDRVRGALTLFTGDRQLAEELAQEAFVKTCQHWEKVRAMDAPGAWVHRVGINLAISRSRRRRTERRTVARLAAVASAPSQIEDEPVDEELRTAVAALPIDERSVLVLRYLVDLSVAGTAAALDVPEGTVKTRTRRALSRLREAGVVSPPSPDEATPADESDDATQEAPR